LKPVKPGFDAALREARLAEAPHLDALVRSQDAGALRLDHLRGRLLDSLPADNPLRKSMEMRLPPEFPPRLFLDLTRSVAMAPDGRNFLLEQDQETHRSTLAATDSAEAMAAEILRLEAHSVIAGARKRAEASVKPILLRVHSLTSMQLALIWTSGFAAGVALLAAIAILMT
jgi:hypothetical protein